MPCALCSFPSCTIVFPGVVHDEAGVLVAMWWVIGGLAAFMKRTGGRLQAVRGITGEVGLAGVSSASGLDVHGLKETLEELDQPCMHNRAYIC